MILAVLALAAAGLYAGNSSRLAGPGTGRPFLLAHRGLAQTFDLAGVTDDTCTAGRIHPPRHAYLENTLAGMRAAFDAGADAVEFDVQRTADDRLAVFHDATLQCRTDGRGKVRDHPLAALRRLDLGYGYTADGGATFPLRGRGVGLLPTVEEVVAAFPGRELLLHVKGADPAEGEAVARYLATLPADRLATITVYGGDAAVDAVAARLPGLRVTSKRIMVACLGRYLGTGWSGYVPDACRHRQLHLPHVYGRWLWGWPHRFAARMHAVDTRVVMVAGSGGFSAGFDRPADLAGRPAGYTGGVWTNQVDVVAPLLRR
ncbi:glycerophosphoryl diester phosphodiesterase [Pilimelia terevasa]|uniref:Glycerophosphoryl diester phosphodiesterase n=1 Tax=Pilimelia terevasa TaxID=53372 RepID=A0A8J3BLA6_9ACTN|nr:glycerophosphoryl diester phosphodiesterase [Pilimelia terevasa]